MTVNEYLRSRLLSGVRDSVSVLEMARTEWSTTFERLMRNRLIVGGYRYGRLGDGDRRGYDTIGAIIKRAERYRDDGNQEHLVDIANLALVEFERGWCHRAPHMSATDDGDHVDHI